MASACVASWTASLPYAPRQQQQLHSSQYYTQTPLRPPSWTGLNLDLSAVSSSSSTRPQKPRLRLATTATPEQPLPTRRFDPFAEDDAPAPVASTSQNTPPPRGRPVTPLTIVVPAPTSGRRRAPSFSAGTPRPSVPLSTLSALSCAPSPAPGLVRSRPPPPAPKEEPPVPLAPTPFHARHYPTPDARARLLARTLLNRIHAVGRPRSNLYASSPYARPSSPSGQRGHGRGLNGYESESGGRGYVPSRLSECVVVAAC